MADLTFLYEMINERRAKRAKIAAQLDALDLEIRTLCEVLARAGGSPSPLKSKRDWSAGPQPKSRGRRLKQEWVETLQFVGRSPGRQASLDAMMKFTEQSGFDIKRATMRSQASLYVKEGILERVSQGNFRLTEAGAEKIGLALNDEGPAEAGPSEGVGVDGRADGYPPVRPAGSSPATSTEHSADDSAAAEHLSNSPAENSSLFEKEDRRTSLPSSQASERQVAHEDSLKFPPR